MIYIVLFLFSFFLTYLVKVYATKKALVDIPNDRNSHSVAVPHGGGIAIAVSWFVGISYLYYFDQMQSPLYFAFMIGVVLSVVSYLDDLFHLSAKVRLVVQSFVAGIGLYFLGGLDEINLFFFTIDNGIVTNIFAFFLILWFINFYNFLDGIDGYAGSEAVFFVIFVVSVLGFLVWNWHPAKIFMGDVGSTLLGYNIAIFTIYYANQDPLNLWIWITLFGLFWFDATLTLWKRYKNHEQLSQAHKKHAYQRLVQSGWSHSKVVKFSIAVNLVLFGLVYFVANMFIAFVLAVIFLALIWRYVGIQKGFEVA